MKKEEQDIRIEARNWCGKDGCSENQAENIALHFYNKGYEDSINSKTTDKKKS